MEPNIGISRPDMDKVSAALKAILAEELGVFFKTLNYHWNVIGPAFKPLHDLFGSQYEELEEITDNIAERMRQLGNMVPGVVDLAAGSAAAKYPDVSSAMKMVQDLLSMHENVIKVIRSYIPQIQGEYKDLGTGNFLTDIMEKHEKIAWMLRAHLETSPK